MIYLRARYRDLDPLGHVNNAAYVDFMDQAAIDHAAALGMNQDQLTAIGGVFVARRHVIDYLAPARQDDQLQILTWIGFAYGARATRFYVIERRPGTVDQPWPLPDRALAPAEPAPAFGPLILRARTDWAYVDVRTGQPRRIPPAVMAAFL